MIANGRNYRADYKHSALKFVLKALIPYSRENMMLGFSPNRFFNELENQSKYSQSALRQAYTRGQQRGYIAPNSPKLTAKGLLKVQPFVAEKLKGSSLMVIFDIPEERANDRRRFRILLKEWEFKQVQKSVWVSDMDYRESLIDVISELKLGGFIEIFESSRLFPVRR